MHRQAAVALAVLAIAATSCGGEETTLDDLPPPLSASEGKTLKKGDSSQSIFANFGEGELTDSGDTARLRYGASRCYTYRIPGTESESDAGGFVTTEVWLLCFDKGKLVHKERRHSRYNR